MLESERESTTEEQTFGGRTSSELTPMGMRRRALHSMSNNGACVQLRRPLERLILVNMQSLVLALKAEQEQNKKIKSF